MPSSIAGSTNVEFGGALVPTMDQGLKGNLDVTGNASVLGTLTAYGAASGVGYSSGAGGAVTQATSKSTGVTLNTPTGQITMNGASLANVTSVAFTLTNSTIGANDVVAVCILSGATTITYQVGVQAVALGSCQINVSNVSGSSQSDTLVLQFVVLKGAKA
jgi:hypothetical protein